MSDYISREAANEACREAVRRYPNSFYNGIEAARNAIRKLPASDVRPNVTGTWVGIDDYPHEEWECDKCGCIVSNSDDPWNYWHFCPNCGARMEER